MKIAIRQYCLRAETSAKILFFSDVHFRFRKYDHRTYGCQAQYRAMLKFAQRLHPDAIVLAGDNLNSVDELSEPEKLQTYLTCIGELSKIAPVFYGIGNHEQRCRLQLSDDQIRQRSHHILAAVAKVPSVTLLDNDSAKITPGLTIAGITLSKYYYNHTLSRDKKRGVLRKTIKDNSEMLKKAKRTGENTLVVLIHSPEHIGPTELKMMSEVDYIICGHMHNGCIPTKLQKFLPGTRGIISPDKHFFPRNARDGFKSYTDKVITLGAVCNFSDNLEPLNLICVPQFTVMDFSDANYSISPRIIPQKIINL